MRPNIVDAKGCMKFTFDGVYFEEELACCLTMFTFKYKRGSKALLDDVEGALRVIERFATWLSRKRGFKVRAVHVLRFEGAYEVYICPEEGFGHGEEAW